MKILIIKQSSLGDVLHSTGVVRALKSQFPDAEITLLTSIGCAPVYAHNPDVARIIAVDREAIKARWKRQPAWVWQHVREVMRQVNDREYDLAIDLQGLAKSVLFLYAAKAKKKLVKGQFPGLAGFRNKNLHAIEEMAEVVKLAGVDITDWQSDCRMQIFTSPEDQKAANGLRKTLGWNGKHRCAVVSPLTRWPSKNWPLDHFVTLAAKLTEQGISIALSGAPEDAEKIHAELARQNLDTHSDIHNIAGALSLPAFAEFLRQADLLVTGDSFPMHLAGAADTPVLALFGPTDESKTGPLGDNAAVIRAPACQMCDRPSCEKRCLSQIDVASVVQKVMEMPAYKP